MTRQATQKSKFLSLVLRHRPDLIGITLDKAGWTPVVDLLAALDRHGKPLSLQKLETLVTESDKQRFAFNADRSMIRANQGHSVAVDLGLPPAEPPETLYHGTVQQSVDSIMRTGLSKAKRHHVHLHADSDTAARVGKRRGKPVILSIDASAMHRGGFRFYLTPNNVWLTETVPPEYIRAPSTGPDNGNG